MEIPKLREGFIAAVTTTAVVAVGTAAIHYFSAGALISFLGGATMSDLDRLATRPTLVVAHFKPAESNVHKPNASHTQKLISSGEGFCYLSSIKGEYNATGSTVAEAAIYESDGAWWLDVKDGGGETFATATCFRFNVETISKPR